MNIHDHYEESYAEDECGDLFSYRLIRKADNATVLQLFNYTDTSKPQVWKWHICDEDDDTPAEGEVVGFQEALQEATEALKTHLPHVHRHYCYLKLQQARESWRAARDAMEAAHEAFRAAEEAYRNAEVELANAR